MTTQPPRNTLSSGWSNRLRWRVCILAAFVLVSIGDLSATTIRGMDIDRVARDAELIFEGEVIQHDSQINSGTGIIDTYVTFAVTDVLKGDYSSEQLELKFTGGTHEGQSVQVSGLKIPAVGEQGIYFVESVTRSLINPLLGWSQGHFIISELDGERTVNTANEEPVIEVMPVSNIPATIKKPLGLIEGNADSAAGVLTDTSALRVQRPMSVEEFKTRIRELIEN